MSFAVLKLSRFPLRLKSFESFNIHRLLRRRFIDRLVVALKWVLVGISFAIIVIFGEEYFFGRVDSATKIQKFENTLDAALATAARETTSQTKKPDYSLIATKNIMGKLGGPDAPKTTEPPAKPTSSLPLSLIGTFVTKGEQPYAIIEEGKKKNQEMFAVGDKVFEEAKLISIEVDRVTINRGGKNETLLLDNTPDGGSDSKEGVATLENDQFVVDEGELDKALENLPLLLTQARAVPFFKEGRAVGLRLFAIKTGSLFEKIGLQNGDVLKAINGSSLGDLSQAMQLFQKLKEERNITVVLDRNLTERTFRYDIR